MGKICVLGSYNQDLTMYCDTFPQPKETVKNGTFKMDSLQDFLKTFNEHAEKSGIPKVTENSKLMNETGDHVNHEFAELKNTNEAEIHVEPLFIVALKKLLNEVINIWAKE